MIGATYVFPALAHEWLKHELDPQFTRKEITIASGAGELLTGTVLGRITKGGASVQAKEGNTGNGTFTLDATTPVLAAAVVGVYTLRCIAAATNGGTFRLEDPNGVVLGDFALAAGSATVNEHIKGVIADGSTDFVVGDGFDITVAAGSGQWVKYNPTLTNGAGVAAGILLNRVDATSGAQKAVAIVRDAVINPLSLVWDSSVDNQDKKNAGLADLAKLGIVTRQIV